MAKKTAKKGRAKPAPKRGSKNTRAVRVRMYRHGLGDCFLLTFPKPTDGDFHVLIDCGVIQGTPGGAELMKDVAADVAEATGGKIDVLAVTHEHWDHVSGFAQALAEFDRMEVGQVWLAWTEDPENSLACRLRAERAQRLAALWIGLRKMNQRLGGDSPARGPVERAAEVLGFFGIDPAHDEPPQGGLGAAAAAAVKTTGDIMSWLRRKGHPPRFFRPGEQDELKEAGGVRVYVLGPPMDTKLLFKDLPTCSDRETYGARLAAAEREFFAAAFFANGDQGDGPRFDPSLPFDQKYRIDQDFARETDFFRDHYFGASADGDPEAWRRIDDDWMSRAAEIALKLDSDTNNTSLALAFELPDGRVLLFPGDAQVGNWESWYIDEQGEPRVWRAGGREVTAERLLNRTVLYKVGHHGSHNATLRAKGLETMTNPSLAAMLPVDVYIAHEKKKWKQMPFEPLLSRLDELAQGRILQADRDVQVMREAAADEAPPRQEALKRFLARVSDAKQSIAVAATGGKTVRRPLYVDYLL
jgi:hypothetical protein